jgi:hypothetical protein
VNLALTIKAGGRMIGTEAKTNGQKLMKLAYRSNSGHILVSTAEGKRLDRLTFADAQALMGFSRFEYDRRKSFAKTSNRAWADGVQWS